MKEAKWRIVLTLVLVLILTASFNGCAGGKGKVAVIRLGGIIASSSQQGLFTTASISPKLVREYLKKAESDAYLIQKKGNRCSNSNKVASSQGERRAGHIITYGG